MSIIGSPKSAESDDDRDIMPPPKKILRPGTPEFVEAVRKKEVELSFSVDHEPQRQVQVQRVVDTGKELPRFSKYVPQINYTGSYENEDGDSRREAAGGYDHDYRLIHHDREQDFEDQANDHKESGDEFVHKVSQDPPPSIGTTGSQQTATGEEIITFRDVIGHDDVKMRAAEMLLPLTIPKNVSDKIFKGIRSVSSNMILHGPPGCGKTRLARAFAGEAKAAFLCVGPGDILSKFVGESEAQVRAIFQKAHELAKEKESKCAVLFFDEIDAIGQSRGGEGAGSGSEPFSKRILAELLIQLNDPNRFRSNALEDSEGAEGGSFDDLDDESQDSVYERSKSPISQESQSPSSDQADETRIIVLAATNRPGDCDTALMRRFPVRVEVAEPKSRDRVKIIQYFLRDVDHELSDAHLEAVADLTDGWTGSDLEGLAREAAMIPVRECIASSSRLARWNRGDPNGESPPELIDVDDGGRESLLQKFLTMRPISFQDFETSVKFISPNNRAMGLSDDSSYDEK